MQTRFGEIPDRFLRDMTVADLHDYVRRPTRRHFLRGALATGVAVAVGPQLWQRAARAAASPPSGVHLAFGTDPTTELTVVWSTPGPVDNPSLSYGIGELGTTVAAETRTVPATLTDQLPTHYHRAVLHGLEPGSTYRYRVAHDGAELGGLSFATSAVDPGPFTFTAFGDQGATDTAARVASLVAAVKPAFHLVAGDCSYANDLGTTTPTDALDFDPAVWDRWFTQNAVSTASTPWMIALGNHDVEPGYGEQGYEAHRARLATPAGGFSEFVYSFRYGNVAVVSPDANDISEEIPHPYSGGAQTAWLDAELGRLRADSAIDFIVVQFHHCAYSTITSHGSDGGVREQWVPLFDKHGVDLVINGHNHGYERTTPIRGGAPTVEAPTGATVRPADHGTTYVCAGGGGRSPNELGPRGQGFVSHGPAAHELQVTGEPEAAPWSTTAAATNGFLRVDVTPPGADGVATMKLTAIDSDGRPFDGVTLVRQRAGAPVAPGPSPAPATDVEAVTTEQPAGVLAVTGDDATRAAAIAAAAGAAALAVRAATRS